MKYYSLLFLFLILPILGCEPPSGPPRTSLWVTLGNVEELVLFGDMDYDISFNIFCLLDPESSIQYLAIERLTVPEWTDPNELIVAEVYINKDLPIFMLQENEKVQFKRDAGDVSLSYPQWDRYSISDSTMDVLYVGQYSITYDDTVIYDYKLFEPETTIVAINGSTTIPGPFQIASPPESSLVGTGDKLTIAWSPSADAYGYIVFLADAGADSIAVYNRYKAATTETSYTLPLTIDQVFYVDRSGEQAPKLYSVVIWAVDKNYFYYYMSDPYNRLSPDMSGMEGASGLYGSRVIRRGNFYINDD